MKILYTASTARHIRDFHLPVLERLAGDGHAVTVACRDAASLAGPFETLELPYAKGFFSPANLSVWGRLLSRFRRERYGLVLTHTALAGFLTRAALGAAGKRDTVCVHTAHGYLFGKNAPLTGRLTYGFERLCAPVTDAVITMNAEDFGYAGRLTRKGGRVAALAGMGI
ncbi:MAG: glycosyltransferase, partial [Oscillospiraceae bacterium]|nr:glycosyltransferase [Oscillospiraceae bacterium]